MADSLLIRKMKEEDLVKCLELTVQLGYPNNSLEDLKKRFIQISRQNQDELFVATINNDVVGWLHMELRWMLEVEHRATVSAIVVDEKVRGQGVGKKLMSFAEEWGRARGVSVLSLQSSTHRKQTHAFYESIGWAKTKEHYQFQKKLK
jgi:GNAT superfamily N-acetyltransferase